MRGPLFVYIIWWTRGFVNPPVVKTPGPKRGGGVVIQRLLIALDSSGGISPQRSCGAW